MSLLENSLFVVGIELGLPYSFYAIASKLDLKEKRNAFSIHSLQKKFRASSSILFDVDKEIEAFGFEADELFKEIEEDEEEEDWYYFQNFEEVFNNQVITEFTEIRDAAGKPMAAIEVFSKTIAFFRNESIKEVRQKMKCKVNDDDIYYVFTVSANHKQAIEFIYLAAQRAGISERTFTVIPRHVAALAMFHFQSSKDRSEPSQYNRQSLVVEIGDENTRIIAVAVKQGVANLTVLGQIPWAGKSVERAFKGAFEAVFTESVLQQLQEEDFKDYLEFLMNIKTKTMSIQSKEDKDMVITIPIGLIQLIKKKFLTVEEAIKRSMYKSVMRYSNQKLYIKPNVFVQVFHETRTQIIEFIRNSLSTPKLRDVKRVLMFGDSALCASMKDVCLVDRSISLIAFDNPEHVAVKGAISFAYCQEELSIGSMTWENVVPAGTTTEGRKREAQTLVEKCVVCTKVGTFYCFDCDETYCATCKKTHDKIPSSKTHTVSKSNVVDRRTMKSYASCHHHKQVFSFTCSDCFVLICTKCVTTKHKGHNISDIKSAVDEKMIEAKKIVDILKKDLRKLEVDISDIKSLNIGREAKKAIDQVRSIERKWNDAVKVQVTLRRNEIEDAHQFQQDEVKYELSKRERELKKQASILQSLKSLLQETDNVAFLTTFDVLRNEIIDVHDIMGPPCTSEIRELDEVRFMQETVNAVLSSFDMSPVAVRNGEVILQRNPPSTRKEPKSKKK